MRSAASFARMGRKLAFAALALFAWHAESHATAPIYDPVVLNVGINCHWEQSCQRRQIKAMRSARSYMERSRPPLWRIHLCNRNAHRGTANVDWVGFNDCIRNTQLARPRQRRR